MRLTIARKAFLVTLTAVRGAADPKAAVPVLGNILLGAEVGALGGRLTASATDLYRVATTSALCDVATAGSVCLPAADILERVRAMPEGDILVTLDGTSATLKASAGQRRYKLHGIPGSEFPILVTPDGAPALTMPADAFALMLARVAPSVSNDVTRPHINSALIVRTGSQLRMVSTDGHRLTMADATVGGDYPPSALDAGILIPLSALSELRKLLDGATGSVSLSVPSDGPWMHVTFSDSPVTFSCKMPVAQFPPYQQVIPAASGERTARVNRAGFSDACAKVAIAAGDKTSNVTLTFTAGAVKVLAKSAESGDGFDEVPCAYAAADVTIGVNASYMCAALAAVDCDEVDIGVSAALDPITVRPVGSVGFVAVLMPVRL